MKDADVDPKNRSCVNSLVWELVQEPRYAGLPPDVFNELCHKIKVAATMDADAIRRDANFAVDKLSEALANMTKMLQDKEQTIEDMVCLEPRRNCDRFNSGDPSKDLESAWEAYLKVRDDGAEDFERWLLEPKTPVSFADSSESEAAQ